jgi:hypothetical protein
VFGLISKCGMIAKYFGCGKIFVMGKTTLTKANRIRKKVRNVMV